MFKPKVTDWMLILACVKEKRDQLKGPLASQFSELHDEIEGLIEQLFIDARKENN